MGVNDVTLGRYVKSRETGMVFLYTEILGAREDMIPCDVDGNVKVAETPKPKQKEEPKIKVPKKSAKKKDAPAVDASAADMSELDK